MKALSIAIQAGVPTLIWGPPGIGKTAYINSLGKAMNLPVEVEIGSTREPSDFGYSVVTQDGLKKVPPGWAIRLEKQGRGILFLDELSTASPSVQAAMLRVVHERDVGDLKLPDAVSIVAAANPPEMAAGGWDLTAPMANRFCHLYWNPSYKNWVEGMISGWPEPEITKLPSNWEKKLPETKNMIASFINHKPTSLNQPPKEESLAGKAWPSGRTWDMAARLLAASFSISTGDKTDEETNLQLIAGCVGEAAAIEFLTWRKALNLPNPEDVLKNPEEFKLPVQGDIAFAAINSVIAAVIAEPSKTRWIAAWKMLRRVVEQGGKDIVIPSAKTLITNPTFKTGYNVRPLPKEVEHFLEDMADFLKISGLMRK